MFSNPPAILFTNLTYIITFFTITNIIIIIIILFNKNEKLYIGGTLVPTYIIFS